MKNENFTSKEDRKCEDKCFLKWVDCMELEGDGHTCKTIEKHCLETCTE